MAIHGGQFRPRVGERLKSIFGKVRLGVSRYCAVPIRLDQEEFCSFEPFRCRAERKCPLVQFSGQVNVAALSNS
jgi:hypothetical protein